MSPPAREPSRGVESGLSKTIFLDLRDINVVDVLKFLALEGNLNIVTSKNVQGRSTLVLKNVSIRDALDIIAISNQLAYEIKKDIIYVMTEDEYRQVYGQNYNDKKKVLTRTLKYAKPSHAITVLQAVQSALGKIIVDEETGTVIMIDTTEKLKEMDRIIRDIEQQLETKVVKLQYASAKDVETQLRARLDAKAVGSVFADERANQLVISAYPGRMKEIVPLVQKLDLKTKAILLDTRIIQITINPKFDFGIDWEKAFTRSGNQSLKALDFRGAFPISSTVSSSTSLGTVGKMAIGKISEDDFNIEVKLLKQVQKTNVLANPRLTVLDRQEAKIVIGDKIPYVVTTTTGTGNNVSVSEEIKFIDVGLSLAVTPIINDDGYITLKIRPEISSRTGTLVTPAKAEIPLVNTTFVESTVVVKDGVTVILGGLRRDDLTEVTKGWRYMMDIPILGFIFRSRGDSMTKTEIVMFITPKIISGADSITDAPLTMKPSRLPVLPPT
jgi:type II secretory pathway component GspD/PulD (secretin)